MSNQQVHSTLVIDPQHTEAKLAANFENDLRKCNNPHVVMMIGKTRAGKSSFLNSLVTGNNNSSIPFVKGGGPTAVTQDFGYYIIKSKDLAKNHHLETNLDCDIILVDSEGTENIERMTQNLRIGGLVMQSITTSLLYKSMSYPTENEYKEIRSYLVMYKLFGGLDKYPHCNIIVRDIVIDEGANSPLIQIENFSKETKKQLISRLNQDEVPVEEVLSVTCMAHILQKDLYMEGVKKIANDILQECSIDKQTPEELINRIQMTASFVKDQPNLLKCDSSTSHILRTLVEDYSKKETQLIFDELIADCTNEMNIKKPAELRIFNRESYVNEKKNKFEQEFQNKIFVKFKSFNKFLYKPLDKVKADFSNQLDQINKIIDDKYANTIVWPSTVQDLCKELSVNALESEKTYTLYENKKPYQIISKGGLNVTLPGLNATKTFHHYQTNGGINESNSWALIAYFDPSKKQVILNDNYLPYETFTTRGCRHGFPPRRPTYNHVKTHYIKVNVGEGFEFGAVKGSNVATSNNGNSICCQSNGGSGKIEIIELRIKN